MNINRHIKENPHLSTVLGYAWPPSPRLTYQREQMETGDGDFFHVDWLGKDEHGPILVVLHGLEGSSEAPYVRRLARLARSNGFRIAAMNHRSCSGHDNRTVRCYHSGFTDDVAQLLNALQTRSPGSAVYAVGFSLGGSILANHLGRNELTSNLKGACLCATPFNLAPGAVALQTGLTRLYEIRFLLSLKKKVKAKARSHPQAETWLSGTLAAKTLEAFDHHWTAPSFGFDSGADYYARASSAPFVANISIPTKVIHAQNDPIVVPNCFPGDALNQNPNLTLEIHPHGGHMGFWEAQPNFLAERILDFFT